MDGQVNVRGELFKIHLMNNTFAFDQDTHDRWDQVSGDEISATGNYAAIDISGELTLDDTNDRSQMTWGTITFTASGDSFDASGAALIRRNVGSGEILECIDFGTDYTITAGNSLQLQNLVLNQN